LAHLDKTSWKLYISTSHAAAENITKALNISKLSASKIHVISPVKSQSIFCKFDWHGPKVGGHLALFCAHQINGVNSRLS